MRRLPLTLGLVMLACAFTTASASATTRCHQGTAEEPKPDCPGRLGGSFAADDKIPRPNLDGAPSYASFHDRDVCHEVAAWATPHHDTLHGIHVTFYFVWTVFGDRLLVCGHKHEVHGVSQGPNQHGSSLPCPRVVTRTKGGVKYNQHTRPTAVGWWVSQWRPYTQAWGSFGHNDDGFWHYKLYNPAAGTVGVRLYGFCG